MRASSIQRAPRAQRQALDSRAGNARLSCAAMLTGLALAAVAPCLVGCNAFAELAENGTLMVLVPNYARQGETVPINVTFPDLGVRLLRESRVTALEFGPLVSARSLEVNDDGSLAITLLVARGAPLGERAVRVTLSNDAAPELTAEATFFVVRPRAP